MRVDVSSNIDQVLTEASRVHPQWQFACAKALTDTAKVVQGAMPVFTESALDRPTTFTKAGFYIQPARKDQLVAAVGIKDRQAQYLAYQVEGGVRSPSRITLRLPSVVDLNEYGNLPAGMVRQLIARARAGRRATKRQSQRFGVSTAADLFYGEPGTPAIGAHRCIPQAASALRTPPGLLRRGTAHRRTRVRRCARPRVAVSTEHRTLIHRRQRTVGEGSFLGSAPRGSFASTFHVFSEVRQLGGHGTGTRDATGQRSLIDSRATMTYSIRQMAAALGVSKSQVARDAKAGMPLLDVAAARAWRAAHQDLARAAEGRIDRAAAAAIEDDEPDDDAPPDGDEDTQIYRSERAKREGIRRAREQLALEKERSALVDVQEVSHLQFTAQRLTRDRVEMVPARVAPEVVALVQGGGDGFGVERLIAEHLRQALEDASKAIEEIDDEEDATD